LAKLKRKAVYPGPAEEGNTVGETQGKLAKLQIDNKRTADVHAMDVAEA